jgi:hypothetical protein
MLVEPQSSRSNAAALVGFWLLVVLQALVVPFVLLTIFFGAMGWEHFSSEDKFQVLLLAVYPVWLVAVGFLGKALLKRKQWLAAYVLALSPLLLLGSWLPMLAEV